MILKRTLFVMLAFFIINSANAGTSSTPKEKTINKPKEKTVYLSKETHCRFRKKDKKTYCTDKNNKRITGEIRRYADGEIVLSIPVKNGLIDGKITSNDVKGNLIYTKEYKKGIQEGMHTTYYKDGKIASQVPYINNKKDGVAKYYYENGFLEIQYTYIEDKIDGQAKIYDNSGQILFDLITANNKIIEGKCTYIDNKEQIQTKPLPSIIKDAINESCLEAGTSLAKNQCSIKRREAYNYCNQKWLKNNIKELSPIIEQYKQDNPNKEQTDE